MTSAIAAPYCRSIASVPYRQELLSHYVIFKYIIQQVYPLFSILLRRSMKLSPWINRNILEYGGCLVTDQG